MDIYIIIISTHAHLLECKKVITGDGSVIGTGNLIVHHCSVFVVIVNDTSESNQSLTITHFFYNRFNNCKSFNKHSWYPFL